MRPAVDRFGEGEHDLVGPVVDRAPVAREGSDEETVGIGGGCPPKPAKGDAEDDSTYAAAMEKLKRCGWCSAWTQQDSNFEFGDPIPASLRTTTIAKQLQ